MARRPKLADALAAKRDQIKSTLHILISLAVGNLDPKRPYDTLAARADAYFRSAHILADRTGLLDAFPELVMWHAWIDENINHGPCSRCLAWRCDTEHRLGMFQTVCTKCALELSLAPAAEAAE